MSTTLIGLSIAVCAVLAGLIVFLLVMWLRERNARKADSVRIQQNHQSELTRTEEAHVNAMRQKEEAHQAEIARLAAETLEKVRQTRRETFELARVVQELERGDNERRIGKELERNRLQELSTTIRRKEAEGLALASKRQFPASLRKLYEVYGLALAAGCPGDLASALHNIAIVTAQLGDLEGAVAMVKEAIELAQGHRHSERCSAFHVRPEQTADQRIATYEQHLKVFQQVLTTRKAKDKQNEALVLLTGGQVEEAVACFRESARLAEEGGNPHLKVGNLLNCANALGANDETEKALSLLEEARAVAVTLGENAEFFLTLIETTRMTLENISRSQAFRGHMSRVYNFSQKGDHQGAEGAARDAFREACRSFGPRHYLTAVALDTIGVALSYQGEHGEALENFERALDVAGDWEVTADHIVAIARKHLEVCRAALGYRDGEADGQGFEEGDGEWRPDGDSEWRPDQD